MLRQVTIIGVGLIGGSIGCALKNNNACNKVIGYSRNENELKKALELGVIDHYYLDLVDAIRGSEIIVLATPVGALEGIFRDLKFILDEDQIITDVGSCKQSVIKAAQEGLGYLPGYFIPGHPIAGTEKSGVDAAFDSLFKNRCTILTPLKHSDEYAIKRVRLMWELIGAEVVEMTAEHHDHVLAATSHLPHILAFSLVDTLAHMNEHSEIFRFAAGGFRDFTRIASSDPLMWRDICLQNKDAILEVLQIYEKQLKTLEQAIREEDGESLKNIFENANRARKEHVIQ